jgi:hypothetical protein
MNRHELGETIAKDMLSNTETGRACLLEVLQKCPYTGVKVEYWYVGRCYSAVGFSKVKWPDEWDEQYGVEMAVKKAAHDIARQICAEEKAFGEPPPGSAVVQGMQTEVVA